MDIFALGAWSARQAGPLLDAFAKSDLGPALAFLILAVGAAAGFAFFAWTSWIWYRLARLRRSLRAIPDQTAFALRLAEADAALGGERLTRHGWSELRDSFVDLSGNDAVIFNTVRPGRFINRHEANLDLRFIQALPNFFVGVGLLFTFIGLVAALRVASAGIGGASVPEMTTALTALLGAATAKFYTSVAGLACSIVLGLLIRGVLGGIDQSFAEIGHLLEERLALVTPEGLSARLVREAHAQSAELKKINTEIAIAIGEQVKKALESALPAHLTQPLEEGIAAMVGAVSAQSRDGLGEMVKAFGDRLEGATQERMGELADTLGRLTATLDAAAQRMGQGGGALDQALTRAAGQLQAAAEAMRDAGEADRGRTREQAEELHQAMSHMASELAKLIADGAARARQGAGEAAGALVDKVARAAEGLAAVAGKIEAAIGRAGERAREAVRETAEDTARKLGDAGIGATAELRNAVAEIGARLGELGEGLTRTTGAMRELETQVAGYASAIGKAEDGTRAAAGALGETANHIRAAAWEAREGLTGAARPLVEVGDRLARATEAARQSNEGLERVLASTEGQARRQAEAAERALEQLEGVWQRHVGRFDCVDEELGSALDQITVKLRENLGHLAKFSTEIDNHTATAVGLFANAIDELAEVAGRPRHPRPPNGNGAGRHP